MHKKFLMVMAIVAGVSLMVSPAFADKQKSGRAGKSNVGHLMLFQKDTTTWEVVEDGAWGKMKYNLMGPTFDFVFNGHGLAGGMYTLIYYPDPWPGNGLICLGDGTARGGNVHIKGSVETSGDLIDAKIWLVPSDDVDCVSQIMKGWNGEEYLFEYNLITFDDTDD
jgi:hypothetical protein